MNRKTYLIHSVLVLAALLILGYIYLYEDLSDEVQTGLRADIYVDDVLFNSVFLSCEKEIIQIKTMYGENALMVINDGIEMTFSTCPDQICIHAFGFQSSAGGMIICLPNRVFVVIEDAN